MKQEILVCGRGLLHRGLVRLLEERAERVSVITAVTRKEVRDHLARHQPDVLICEAAERDRITRLLEKQHRGLRIICLTLERNEMTVHDLSYVANATLEVLVEALSPSRAGEGIVSGRGGREPS